MLCGRVRRQVFGHRTIEEHTMDNGTKFLLFL
jgi:hypothetical protein